MQLDTSLLLENAAFVIKTAALFDTSSMKVAKSAAQFERARTSTRGHICPFVRAHQLTFDGEHLSKVKKISFGIIMLGTLKLSVSIQNHRQLRLNKEIVTTSRALNSAIFLIAPWVQNFSNMSGLRLKFNELVILEAFISEDLLLQNIVDHYVYQLKRHIFSVLGSSDLLGNPANLLSRAGTGFYELAREPLQGMQ